MRNSQPTGQTPRQSPARPPARPQWLESLLSAAAYPHAVGEIRLVETHISWVLLTGDYAYKLKKPLDLGFLNFSTLERRLAACREELRLNARFAAELYLDLVPLTEHGGEIRFGGEGAVIEYAVRMHEFPQSEQLDRLLEAGQLRFEDMERLAQRLGEFHLQAEPAGPSRDYGEPAQVLQPALDNFEALIAEAADAPQRELLQRLQDWSRTRFEALEPLVEARNRDAYVRELHGDLHLANLVRLDAAVVPFDCIEFEPALRWIDTMSDIAFLIMDLARRGRRDLAYAFLNAYLEVTGDYAGLPLLRWYCVYRAMVRAKVARIRSRDCEPAEAARQEAQIGEYLDLAQTWTQQARPRLWLMHGVSGSGKTWVSSRAARLWPAVRVRSDVERKRLHGLAADADSGSGLGTGLYTADAGVQTYAALERAGRSIIDGGESALIDASFLKRAQRDAFYRLADELGVEYRVLVCTAAPDELRRRVAARALEGRDASEAGLEVLEQQLACVEPLDAHERASSIVIDSAKLTSETELEALLRPLASA